MRILRHFVITALLGISAFAQNNGALVPVPRQQPLGNGGQILAGSCMYTYQAGSTTPAYTYSDPDLAVGHRNANPLALDSSGRMPAVYLDATSYKFVFAQKSMGACPGSPGTVIWSQDSVYDFGQLLKAALAATTGASLIGFEPTGGTVPMTVAGALNSFLLDAGYSTFAQACAAAGSTKTLAVAQLWTVPAGTYPCSVWFLKGGTLKVAASVTAAMTGSVTCPTFQQCFDTTTNAGALISFTKPPSNLNPVQYGAVADGTGAAGTSQSAQIQAAIESVHQLASGGSVHVYPAALAYVVGTGVKLYSNVTLDIMPGATLQKIHGTQSACATTGCNSVVYMDPVSAYTNVWVTGGGTVDGNKANVTGISGDGGNFGILFENCTNCGVRGNTIKNSYTGNVTVSCDPLVSVGNNVQILDNIITGSRRNNVEPLCGTNTIISGNYIAGATGGSLRVGIEAEPFAAGQLISGLTIKGNEITANVDGGILIQSKYDVNPSYSVADNDVHDNGSGGSGLYAVNFNIPGAGASEGTVTVTGGTFANNAGVAGIAFAAFKSASVTGENSYGSARGLLLASGVTEARLGPGRLSGTSYDLSVDGPNSHATLAGVNLACTVNCIQPGEEANVTFPMTTVPINATQYGIPWWTGASPRDGQMTISSHIKVCPGDSVNPCLMVDDGAGHTAKLQIIPGVGVFVGSIDGESMCLGANSIWAYAGGTQGGVCVDPTGLLTSINGLQTFANNAAAVAGGLTRVGMLYRITGTDTMGVVH